MNTRALFVALLVAGLGGFLLYVYLQRFEQEASGGAPVKLLVALKPVEPGTVLTDESDQKTLRCDLRVELARETCDWLTQPAASWLAETVTKAVEVEFDRYIAAGDLAQTIARIEQLRAQTDARGGYVGMYL